MGHLLLSFAEFVLVLGGIGIFLVVALLLGLGLAAKTIARMFSSNASKNQKHTPASLSETEQLRLQLSEAQNTAYESALASEKTIQQLQQRLNALEPERAPSFASVR